MKIAIIILAAGKSSRMKTAKQLLPIGDTTLLGFSINNALKSNADETFCVLGANYDRVRSSIEKYNVEIIQNENFEEGLSSSIVVGIQHLKNKNFDGALIILGDQPKISSDYLNCLIDNFKRNKNSIFASDYSGKKGVPAIFPKNHFKDLLQLNGDKGAGLLLNNLIFNVKGVDFKVDLTDLDTPEDHNSFIS